MQTGIIHAILAYSSWGLLPIYLKAIADIAPTEIFVHRMIWSLVFLLILLSLRSQWAWLPLALRAPRVLAGAVLSASLLGMNWLLFIWAINNNHVIDSSLGYFINPLVNVLLGMVFLKERLRPVQWLAVLLAALGVAWLTWHAGQLPWIGLGLAATFAAYGLLRKTAALGALEGLTLETMLWFPVVLVGLVWLAQRGQSGFVSGGMDTRLLLLCAGPLTTIPLLWFASAARRIPLSLLGLLQYIGPSLQLMLGIWLYHEPFERLKLAGYALIWAALLVYSLEALWQGSRTRRAARRAL